MYINNVYFTNCDASFLNSLHDSPLLADTALAATPGPDETAQSRSFVADVDVGGARQGDGGGGGSGGGAGAGDAGGAGAGDAGGVSTAVRPSVRPSVLGCGASSPLSVDAPHSDSTPVSGPEATGSSGCIVESRVGLDTEELDLHGKLSEMEGAIYRMAQRHHSELPGVAVAAKTLSGDHDHVAAVPPLSQHERLEAESPVSVLSPSPPKQREVSRPSTGTNHLAAFNSYVGALEARLGVEGRDAASEAGSPLPDTPARGLPPPARGCAAPDQEPLRHDVVAAEAAKLLEGSCLRHWTPDARVVAGPSHIPVATGPFRSKFASDAYHSAVCAADANVLGVRGRGNVMPSWAAITALQLDEAESALAGLVGVSAAVDAGGDDGEPPPKVDPVHNGDRPSPSGSSPAERASPPCADTARSAASPPSACGHGGDSQLAHEVVRLLRQLDARALAIHSDLTQAVSTSHTRRAVKEGYSVASGRVPPRLHNGDRPDIARWGTYSPFTAGGVGEMANLVPGVRGDQHQPQYDTQVTHAPRVEPSRDRCTAPQLGAAVPGGPRGGWFRLDRVANADSTTCARGNTCDNAGGGVADHQAAAPLPWPAHTRRVGQAEYPAPQARVQVQPVSQGWRDPSRRAHFNECSPRQWLPPPPKKATHRRGKRPKPLVPTPPWR